MHRDLNNVSNNLSDVHNNQNITNLALSLLPTKLDVIASINNNNINYTTTSAINTLFTNTVNTQTTLRRDQAISFALSAYTISISTAILTYNNIISNNLNSLTTTLTNTAISTAITNQVIITNTVISTAITNNNNSMLTRVRTYTGTQTFNNLILLGSNNAISLGNQFGCLCTSVGCSPSAYAFCSTSLGFSSQSNAQYATAIECNATAFSTNSTAVGYSSGIVNIMFININTNIIY